MSFTRRSTCCLGVALALLAASPVAADQSQGWRDTAAGSVGSAQSP